jgi:hypothetical protein
MSNGIRLDDMLTSINTAFPILSFGQKDLDHRLNRFSSSPYEVGERWDYYNKLSMNVLNFLRQEFPSLDKNAHLAICELALYSIQENFERIDDEHEWYQSLLKRSVN